MTLAEELRDAQLRLNMLIRHIKNANCASEFSSILIEHILLHPDDGYCDYPVYSSDFPRFTKVDKEWLLRNGFTVDMTLNENMVRIFWVNPDDTNGG